MSNGLKALWASAVSLIAGVVLGVAFLKNPGQSTSEAGAKSDERIILITHGQAADPFWNIVRRGAEDAADQLGVKVDYRAPETFDMIRMAELISSATNQRPAGIIVSIPDASALSGPIRNATRAGIPLCSINSGEEVAARLGAIAHVGQNEFEAGKRLGERLRQEGARKPLCVNHEVGNTALDARCKGVQDGFGSSVAVLPTSTDPQEVLSKISAALAADSKVDALVALNAVLVGEPAVEASRVAGRRIKVASFDLSPGFLNAVASGEAAFAVEQQPYLQGYLSTIVLANYARYGIVPANRLIESGPSFVTRANARKVLALSRQAIR